MARAQAFRPHRCHERVVVLSECAAFKRGERRTMQNGSERAFPSYGEVFGGGVDATYFRLANDILVFAEDSFSISSRCHSCGVCDSHPCMLSAVVFSTCGGIYLPDSGPDPTSTYLGGTGRFWPGLPFMYLGAKIVSWAVDLAGICLRGISGRRPVCFDCRQV